MLKKNLFIYGKYIYISEIKPNIWANFGYRLKLSILVNFIRRFNSEQFSSQFYMRFDFSISTNLDFEAS